MNLKDQVRLSLKWKKSDEICADRLRLNLELYKKIKQEIKLEKYLQPPVEVTKEKVVEFKENLTSGTAEIKGITLSEPKSPQEIERILKIDTTKWKLSSYWNKEHRDHWLISAMVTRVKSDPVKEIEKVLNDFDFKYTPSSPVHINKLYSTKTCAVLSLQDIHIGKANIDGIDDIIESTKNCVINLIMRTYHSCNLDKIIFVLGGDLLNVDTYLGQTTSGTQVESSMSALDMYKKAFELMFWTINYLKQFCNELEVVYIPGNHDRLSSGQLAYSLSKVINDSNIIWNIEYSERKVVTYGNSMICVEHGDVTLNKSFFVFATEYAKQWGESKYRTLYSGHYHKEKKVEYITTDEINGFTMRILPSLSRADHYHSVNKWVNNKRGGIIELHSEFNGPTGHFSYYE